MISNRPFEKIAATAICCFTSSLQTVKTASLYPSDFSPEELGKGSPSASNLMPREFIVMDRSVNA